MHGITVATAVITSITVIVTRTGTSAITARSGTACARCTRPHPLAGPCTCLSKEYTTDGRVLFKDLCTNEAAINPRLWLRSRRARSMRRCSRLQRGPVPDGAGERDAAGRPDDRAAEVSIRVRESS